MVGIKLFWFSENYLLFVAYKNRVKFVSILESISLRPKSLYFLLKIGIRSVKVAYGDPFLFLEIGSYPVDSMFKKSNWFLYGFFYSKVTLVRTTDFHFILLFCLFRPQKCANTRTIKGYATFYLPVLPSHGLSPDWAYIRHGFYIVQQSKRLKL